ncbi:MAG: DUF4114 domain-containing protein [Cyanothece sp. SIO1E1]|nr:DUF4114 domain-containing protein [Cyanothece sp. SIO1E1]
MKIFSINKFILATATFAAMFMAAEAHAASIGTPGDLNLRQSNEALFDEFNSRVNQERLALDEDTLPEIVADTLRVDETGGPVDVFFINEGAGFRNQLLFSVNDGPLELLFADVSSPESILSNSNGPLALGDGLSITGLEANDQIDFFIRANGARNPNGNIFGGDPAANPDGLQHLVAFDFVDDNGESFVLFGFEDLFGPLGGSGRSDRDFNDAVFAARGVTGDRVEDVPEPASALALLSLGALGATQLRRRQLAS